MIGCQVIDVTAGFVAHLYNNSLALLLSKKSYYNILFTVYVIEVYTGNKAGAGTDAHVFVTLFGKRGQTPKTQLSSKYVLTHLYYCCLHNDRA